MDKTRIHMRTISARTTTTVAALTCLLCCATRTLIRAEPPLPADSAVGAWKKCSPMPQGAVFAGTALGLNGRIYVVSGSTRYDVHLTAAVHVYDPEQDAWTEASPLPTPRTEPGAAVGPDGRIYLLGGSDPDYKKNVAEAYDPRTDSWSRLAPMPTPREALCAVAAPGADGHIRIYAIGGRDRAKPGNGLSVVEVYDPTTDRWSIMAPMPTPRHAHAATLGPDGRIYVLGGTNAKISATNLVEIYDPGKDSWSQGPPAPYGQECAAAATSPGPEGEVLMIGGWNSRKRPLRRGAAFNPRTNTWRTLPPPSYARAAGGAVVLQRADGERDLYLVGGTGEDGQGRRHPSVPVETTVEEYSFRPVSRHR